MTILFAQLQISILTTAHLTKKKCNSNAQNDITNSVAKGIDMKTTQTYYNFNFIKFGVSKAKCICIYNFMNY